MKSSISNTGQRGIVLLEGLIAMLIFSLGILAIVGLQAAVTRHATDAKYRADASFIANQSIGLMWADRKNLANYEVTDEDVAALPSGKRSVEVTGDTVKITVTWKMPGEAAAHNFTLISQIRG
jgi:type IV pilus assembly protein PilV